MKSVCGVPKWFTLRTCFLWVTGTKMLYEQKYTILSGHSLFYWCYQLLFFYFLNYKTNYTFVFLNFFVVFSCSQSFFLLLCKNGSWGSKWDVVRLSKLEIINVDLSKRNETCHDVFFLFSSQYMLMPLSGHALLRWQQTAFFIVLPGHTPFQRTTIYFYYLL